MARPGEIDGRLRDALRPTHAGDGLHARGVRTSKGRVLRLMRRSKCWRRPGPAIPITGWGGKPVFVPRPLLRPYAMATPSISIRALNASPVTATAERAGRFALWK